MDPSDCEVKVAEVSNSLADDGGQTHSGSTFREFAKYF